MRTDYKKILMFVLMAAFFLSCDKTVPFTPELSVNISDNIFRPEGGKKTIPVTSNTNWSAASNKDWLTVAPENATESTTSVTISLKENPEQSSRTATVTLTPENGEATQFNVTQEGLKFSSDKKELTLDRSRSNGSFTLTTNTQWKAATDAEWISLSPSQGLGLKNEEINILADKNATVEKRNATITITPTLGEPITIAVSQKGGYHLFLLVGQSNMVGVGEIEAQDQETHPRVFMLKSDKFMIAREPVHYSKVGPGLVFGKTLADAFTEAEIGLIPAAVGGTKISYWAPDNDERGLYKEAVRKARVAMNSGTIKGIVWQQGESDSYSQSDADKYKGELIVLINSFREDLGDENIPVVIGGLGNFLKGTYVGRLNDVFKEVANTEHLVGFSEASKLGHIGDNLHFNSAAQRENGRNMGEAMIKLLEEAESNK